MSQNTEPKMGQEAEPAMDQSMDSNAHDTRGLFKFGISPWIALVVSIVLCIGIVGNVYSNYHGAASTMKRILLEKGASLIRSFEAGARMRMRHASDIRLQLLLEEMASQSDIHFTAVINKEGRILSHSNPDLIGTYMTIGAEPLVLEASEKPQWKVLHIGDEKSFVVYENFNPLREKRFGPHETNTDQDRFHEQKKSAHVQREKKNKKRRSHVFPDRPQEFWDTITTLRSTNTDGAMMLVGLDVEDLEAARVQDRRMRALILCLLFGTMALSAVALWRFQKERQAQMKEQQALENERQAQLKEQQAQKQVRALEAEIRQREKQAAMGHLAAGVAHELRNPLSSIKGYATYFGTRFPEGSEDRHAAGIMVQEVDRLNRVITDLINLAKPSDLHLVEHSGEAVCQLVDRALRLLQHEAKARGVAVHFDCAEDLPSTHLDPDRFLQALLNVWLNALDSFQAVPPASSRPSRPSQPAQPAQAQERSLYVTITSSLQGKLCVTNRDTGVGIPASQLSKICDPYFTTKSQGTGLGLAIVQKIIEAHGGRMDVTSEVGKGTIVEFLI